MRIAVIGSHENLQECRRKFGEHHHYFFEPGRSQALSVLGPGDVVFDFATDPDLSAFSVYGLVNLKAVFFSTITISLKSIPAANRSWPLFGFAGMPTFLDRKILEASAISTEDEDKLAAICKELDTDFEKVSDAVGLVTPRVIGMIINEAYYAAMEGTATREDIDIAMKLGTNYPYGPFEWCNKIGIGSVHRMLAAVYEHTAEERYAICPLLKQEFEASLKEEMPLLIIVRHGQSAWNLENRFTGDVDVDLTGQGQAEARNAGRLLAAIHFDAAFTSVLKRAVKTLEIILTENQDGNIPITRSSALNERMYGDLQGLNKADTIRKYGEAQVLQWRRSFREAPPGGESLADTANRVVPYYQQNVEPLLASGKSVLVVAHGNSLRALMMHLEHISETDIATVDLLTGVPREYKFDQKMGLISAKNL